MKDSPQGLNSRYELEKIIISEHREGEHKVKKEEKEEQEKKGEGEKGGRKRKNLQEP